MDILSNRFLSFESQEMVFSVGDFTNLVQIGHGGFSKVFKAFHSKMQRFFALK